MALGDAVKRALELVGVTEERVALWFGRCCCEERRRKLNALGAWAAQALKGRANGTYFDADGGEVEQPNDG